MDVERGLGDILQSDVSYFALHELQPKIVNLHALPQQLEHSIGVLQKVDLVFDSSCDEFHSHAHTFAQCADYVFEETQSQFPQFDDRLDVLLVDGMFGDVECSADLLIDAFADV